MSNNYIKIIQNKDFEKIKEISNNLLLNKDEKNLKKIFFNVINQTFLLNVNYEFFEKIFDFFIENEQFLNLILNFLKEILWLIGFDLKKEETEKNKIYSQIINYFLKKNLINTNELKEELEENTLEFSNIENDMKSFKKKITITNTKMFFEQKKYNLLREESEGFSKLINLLFDFGEIEINNAKNYTNKIIETLVSLIGFFDLEPTRVLDIVLEAFKYNSQNTNFIKIFETLNKNAISDVIGFKIEYLKKNTNDKNDAKLLFTIIAQLIKFNILTINEILVHLNPNLNEMKKIYEQRILNCKNYCDEKITNKINNEIKATFSSFYIDENINSNFNLKLSNNFSNFYEIANETINYFEFQNKNQIYFLLEKLFYVRDFKHSKILYNIIKEFYDPLENKDLIYTLCNLIAWIIEPLINNIKNENDSNNLINKENEFYQCFNIDDLFNQLPFILEVLSIGLSKNQIIFQKILKLIRKNINVINSNEKYKNILLNNLIINSFFPSLSLTESSPSLINEIWILLSFYEYSNRYILYYKWQTQIYNKHPYLFMKYYSIDLEIRKWLKCLSKDNQKNQSRILSLISNSNPIIVFNIIIKTLITYENQINLFIGTLSFISNLSIDVITYVICSILNEYDNKNKINYEMRDLELWFKNLTYFIGAFYKKNYNAEINGLLDFIINKFKNDNDNKNLILIIVLKEMIEKMGGIKTHQNFNKENIISEECGLHLYLNERGMNKEIKTFKKPSLSLIKYFNDNNLTVVMLILFFIKKNNLIYNTLEKNHEFISFLCDQVNYVKIQFEVFFKFYDNNLIYKKLENNFFENMSKNYNLTPTIIFCFIRKKVKNLYELNENEFNENVIFFQKIFNNYNLNKIEFLKNEFLSDYLDTNKFIENLYYPIWDFICPKFYLIFNYLELKDIFFPEDLFNSQINELKSEKIKIINNYYYNNSNENFQNLTLNNLHLFNESKIENLKIKKEIDKLNIEIDILLKDMNALQIHTNKIKNYLKNLKIFQEISNNNIINIPKYLIQFLLYPRIILNKNDAIYCEKILFYILTLNINHLNIFIIFKNLNEILLNSIICSTEYEAINIGTFLNEFLNDMKKLKNEKYYNEISNNNNSFSKSLDKKDINFEDFKYALSLYLSKLSENLKNIIANSNDYISLSNTVNVLDKLIDFIPNTKEDADNLITVLDIEIKNNNEIDKKKNVLINSYRDKINFKFKDDKNNKKDNNQKSSKINREKSNYKSNHNSEYKKNDNRRERSRDKENDNKGDNQDYYNDKKIYDKMNKRDDYRKRK